MSNSSKTKIQPKGSPKSLNDLQLKGSKIQIQPRSKNSSVESLFKAPSPNEPPSNIFEGLDLGPRLTLKNEEIQVSVRNAKLMIDHGLSSITSSQDKIRKASCATNTEDCRKSLETVKNYSPSRSRKSSSFGSLQPNIPSSLKLTDIKSQSKSILPGTLLKSTESIHNFAVKLSPIMSQSILTSPGDKSGSSVEKSMLVTGFGMRNLESLQRALLDDEQRRQLLYHKYDKDTELKCESYETFSTPSKSSLSSKFSEEGTQSENLSGSLRKQQLDYLMGFTEGGEEEGFQVEIGPREEVFDIEDEDSATGTTMAMRKAQRYLRNHKIFEFFQFLIAHMLSAVPENPIKFLLELLDKCLIYRSGLGHPPLLYEKQHLEQLFYLMDRLRTGFIEVQQYKTGMVTLGICSYDKNPPLSPDGMVAKDIFITEAYDCLSDLFHDMIRRRKGKLTSPSISIMTPPPTLADLSSVGSGQ